MSEVVLITTFTARRKSRWLSAGNGLRSIVLADGAGAAYAPMAVYPAVQAGRVVRGAPKVRAHHTVNGALVFEVRATYGSTRCDSTWVLVCRGRCAGRCR